jgi:hypothetical protein
VLYDVSRNTCKIERHSIDGTGRELFVHDKGATRSFEPNRSEVSLGRVWRISADAAASKHLESSIASKIFICQRLHRSGERHSHKGGTRDHFSIGSFFAFLAPFFVFFTIFFSAIFVLPSKDSLTRTHHTALRLNNVTVLFTTFAM